MKHIAKALIAMLICMAALIGPSVALNPQYNIEISTCEGDGMCDRSLFFDRYTYENGWRVWEMETTINGLAFWLDGSGAVQYIGDPLETYTERTIQYYLYQVDEFGEPVTGNYEGHTVEVHLNPCVEACDWVPLRDTRIEIYEPELGQEIETSIRFPGNGQFASIVYLDGTVSEDRVWNGESCIVVEALVNGAVYARDGITV